MTTGNKIAEFDFTYLGEDYDGEAAYYFDCVGCGDTHVVYTSGNDVPIWKFNGDMKKPTFQPSILSRTGKIGNMATQICHSFVRDGKIQFLNDCTHDLAGQTVDMTEI